MMMDFFQHILWTYVLFRNKLWRDEALVFAILPDIGFLFILFYVFNSSHNFARAIYYMPGEYLIVYNLFHSFVILGIVALVVWKLRPKLLPALSGWSYPYRYTRARRNLRNPIPIPNTAQCILFRPYLA